MEILQHAVVTLLALAAVAVLYRRIVGFAGPGAAGTGCDGCPSAERTCGTTTHAATGAAVQHPAVLIRTSAHVRSQTRR